MKITRAGSQPSRPGQEAHFTGRVRLDPLFSAEAPGRVLGATVTFEPGARTAWHTHPLGQTLIVTHGVARVQCEGGPAKSYAPATSSSSPPTSATGTAPHPPTP